jgi:hypothetical protein
MIDKNHGNQASADEQTEYNRRYTASFDGGRETKSRRRRHPGRSALGLIGLIIGAVFIMLIAAALVFAIFLGGIWLGSLVTDQPTEAPVAPVIPSSAGIDGDVTIIEGDTTVTIAGAGAVRIPTPGTDGLIVTIQPTTIVLPTDGDLSKITIKTGGVTVHQ